MYLDSNHIYRSELLDGLAWLIHGFGTRQSDGWPGDYTHVRQIHSDILIDASGKSGCLGEADALVTREPGSLVGVRTADCIPVVLADAHNRTAAVIHAGWRGTAAGIVRKTVERLGVLYGSRPGNILAAIGPGIGPCCFEVGQDVAAQFGAFSNFRHVDLPAANRDQLLQAGIPAAQVDSVPLCTKCNSSLFHSYRRDKERSGRMVTAAGIRR